APLDRLGAAGCVSGRSPGLVAEGDVAGQGRPAAGHVGVSRVRTTPAEVGAADVDHVLETPQIVVEVAGLPLAERDRVAGAVLDVTRAERRAAVLEDAVGGIGPGAVEAPARTDRPEVVVARCRCAEGSAQGQRRRGAEERGDPRPDRGRIDVDVAV